MIPVTSDIIGPGIEEEYADALAAIDDIGLALGQQQLTNDTPEGRVLLNVLWVEQEIDARRLPIPVDPSFVGTIFYLVGSNELAGVPGFQEALGRLWLVLKGYGLIKPRHVPLLVSMIDDWIADAERCSDPQSEDRRLIADLRIEADRLRQGGEVRSRGSDERSYGARISDALDEQMDKGYLRLSAISASLLEGWRPRPARKPPLPAPLPGLPPEAPMLPEGVVPT